MENYLEGDNRLADEDGRRIDNQIDDDLARWTEQVLIALASAEDSEGRKAWLCGPIQRQILCAAIVAVDSIEAQRTSALFRAVESARKESFLEDMPPKAQAQARE